MPIQFEMMTGCYEYYEITIPHRMMSTTQSAKYGIFQNSS